jgi:two-component system phosphate regulon response regulator PhoB
MEVGMSAAQDSLYTVLVIDDDPDLLPMLADTLHVLTGYMVITATDGAAGLRRFYEAMPHCVVVDVKMPELDGYQFVRALRGDPRSRATPVVMLTAMGQDKERFAGLAAGADQYLVKPIDPVELVASIRRSIQLSEQERQSHLQTLADAQTADDLQ